MTEVTRETLNLYINASKTFKSLHKADVFKEIIAEVLEETSVGLDGTEVLDEIEKREALSTTGFENGFAIPHGKASGIDNPLVVVIKTDQKIEWESLDDQPVSIIFLLIVPKENGDNIHLKLLSKLSYNLMDKAIQKEFKHAESESELKDLINRIIK